MKMRFSFFQFIASAILFSLGAMPVDAFYNPNTGRWLNRDPLEEAGGRNIHGFVNNATLTAFDKDGRLTVTREKDESAQCEQIIFKFWFALDWPAHCEGYIVQENRVYLDESKDCCATFVPPPDKLVDHVWEAFPIGIGEGTFEASGGGFTDGVRYRGVDKSSGALIAHGVVKFFCRERSPEIETQWTPDLRVTGEARATRTRPTWWDEEPNEGPAYRIVEGDWDCCPHTGRPIRWNVTASP